MINMKIFEAMKPKTPEIARYLRRLLVVMTLYVMVLVPVTYVVRRDLVSGSIVYVLAVLPALPIIGVLYIIFRLVVEMKDEYQKLLMVKQLFWATGLTLSTTTIWSFLESYAAVDRIPSFFMTGFWLFALIPAGFLARWDEQ
jgi:hypothetical protein